MTTKLQINKVNFKGKNGWSTAALVEGQIVMDITLVKPMYDSFKKLLDFIFSQTSMKNVNIKMQITKLFLLHCNLIRK